MAKKDKNSLNLRSSVYGTPTINALELKAGANKLGEWFLLGLGAFGKLATAPFTLQGPTSSTIYKSKELLDKEQTIDLKSEELLGKAMSWISPLNYVTAIASGNGLNARKGEEVVSSWSPAMLALGRAGELYFGPKGVKGIKNTPKTIVNTAAKAGSKTAKKVVVARELSNGIKENAKSGRIEVSPEYFKAEDKWYRLSERPEKIGIEELGKNITTQDDPEIPGTIGNWRSTILDDRKGLNGKSKRIVPKPDNGFVLEEGMNFAKHGQAHGNTSQAAKGLIWDGTFAFSNRFPVGIIEGQAPNKIFRGMTAEGKDSRSNFVLLDWEDVPIGSRVGFHTGEMPMSNLGWFQRTNKGTYTYEPIIPEKRISYHPILQLEPSTSLKFFERKPSRISLAERVGVPKGERNLLFKPKLPTEHIQGEEAVRMFKEYGGTPIPEGSINGELLRKYVAEARERYGLTNNKNITDEEIAKALYKHSKELGGNTAVVNTLGEPQLLFRGNTKDFSVFKPRKTPLEFININGTMDNSLGTLFLGELPNSSGDIGVYRYLVRGNDRRGKVVSGAGAGNKARPIIGGEILHNAGTEGIDGLPVVDFPMGTQKVISYNGSKPYSIYKLPPENSSTGFNAVDVYVVRTPAVRDVTTEMKTVPGEGEFKPFSWLIPKEARIGLNEREVLAKQYQEVLNQAEKNLLGLLKSNKGTAYRGDEHGGYDYYALPNFNIRGAKHLLPYDLRIPRNWNDKNIYRTLVPITGGYTLYNLLNQNANHLLEYRKQGGKMNILEFLKNGSGIHIKEKNKGKFTSYCGGKVTDECILKGKNSSNPAIRKRATFALNARHFKHRLGGSIVEAFKLRRLILNSLNNMIND